MDTNLTSEVIAYDYDKSNDKIVLLYKNNDIFKIEIHNYIDHSLPYTYSINHSETQLLNVKFFKEDKPDHLVLIGAEYIYLFRLLKADQVPGNIDLKGQTPSLATNILKIKNTMFTNISFTMGGLFQIFWGEFSKEIQVNQKYAVRSYQDNSESKMVSHFFNRVECSLQN